MAVTKFTRHPDTTAAMRPSQGRHGKLGGGVWR